MPNTPPTPLAARRALAPALLGFAVGEEGREAARALSRDAARIDEAPRCCKREGF